MCRLNECDLNNDSMKSLIEKVIGMVNSGQRYTSDFHTKTIKVGKTYIVKNGKLLQDVDTSFVSDVLCDLLCLYETYKNSVPSEISSKHRHTHFYAVPLEELSREDIMFGNNRLDAMIALEVFFMVVVVTTVLDWDTMIGAEKFFYQSQHDKGFVILREWVK